ncbi:MAG: hypothetical protein OEQ53_21985, partial [Saprospiraceae bacterium]|nr:hypothetical protein [Saprospiraceae bacterium]
ATGGCYPKITYKVNGQEINLEDIEAPSNCGGSVTVEAIVDDLCYWNSCTRTFKVYDAPDLITRCPGNKEVDYCMEQSAVDIAFHMWKGEFSVDGGCDPQVTYYVNGEEVSWISDIEAPDKCGGEITVRCVVDDLCDWRECTATFTVPEAPAIDPTFPQDYTAPACKSEIELHDLFEAWCDQFDAQGGCDPQLSIKVKNANGDFVEVAYKDLEPPSNCGGEITIKWIIDDKCEWLREISTFTVPNAPEVSVYYPQTITIDPCLIQDAVNQKFQEWLDYFYAEGGCDPNLKFKVKNANGDYVEVPKDQLEAPDKCGGKITIKFVMDDLCAWENAVRSFTVENAPEVVVYYPGDPVIPACKTQNEVNGYFLNWLYEFTVAEGCAPSKKYKVNNEYISLDDLKKLTPAACGGELTVHFLMDDLCAWSDERHTFKVLPAPELIVECPDDKDITSCKTQDEIDELFTDWLREFIVDGGCDPSVTYWVNGVEVNDLSEAKAPEHCGGEVTIRCAVVDVCGEYGCTKTFKVAEAAGLIVECPPYYETDPCLSQDRIDVLFSSWLEGFKVMGGCDPESTYYINGEPFDPEDLKAPNACGGDITITCRVDDVCAWDQCTATFSVPEPAQVDVTCPNPVKVPACSSDEEIARYFYAWIDGFKVAGGCDPVSKYWIGHPDNGGVEITVDEAYQRLLKCGFEIELFCFAYDHCTRDICSSVFAIEAPEPVDVTCPDPVKVPACSS